MKIFLITTGLFFAALAAHVAVWKFKLPRRQTRALLFIFAAVFLMGLPFIRLGLPALLHTGLFYITAALCYIITYSAIEGDSPTLSVMLFLDRNSGDRPGENELLEFLEDRPFVQKRIAMLVHDGLIFEREGRYFIAGQPSLFFRMILGFRKLYGPISRGG